jgi:hypothetical protein
MNTSEADMGLGSCLADICPNIDRRILVGVRITDEMIDACCDVEGCIMITTEQTEYEQNEDTAQAHLARTFIPEEGEI